MSKFFYFSLSVIIFILLAIGFLILSKNSKIGIIIEPLASTKESISDLFTLKQQEEVNLFVLEKEDLDEGNTQEQENFEREFEINLELELEKIVEEIDEISEKIDIISQEVKKLLGIKIEKEDEIEKSEEEKIEEVEEEFEESEEMAEELKTPEIEIIVCEKGNQIPLRDKIIFNEISWMGTNEDWRNEWIELKNISNSEIPLNAWQILDKEQEIKIIFEQKDKILAGQFFLLERTNDDSIPNISADKIYSGNLNDSVETLYLFDENCQLQDEILALPDWPAGDKDERRSMERDSDFSWYTYSGVGSFGIFGTPKAENSLKVISSSSDAAPPEEEEDSIPTAFPQKVLISEIFFDAERSDEEQEFIELFNPNDSEVDLSGHSIQYLGSNADSIDKIEKKNFEQGNKIEAKNYFLIGLNGKEEDLKWSQALGNNGGSIILANDKEKITGIEDLNIVDRVGYGTGEGLILAESLVVSLEDFEPGRSLGRKWLEETEEYQDLDNNQEDFEIQEITPGDKNLGIIIPGPIDDIPPEVSFNTISSIQTEKSFSLSWVGQDLALDNVTPSGIDGFSLRYSTASDIDASSIQYQDINNKWQEWPIGQILDFEENENYVNVLTEQNRTYSFQIKAKDKAGNQSDWIKLYIKVDPLAVVINEIAWMGTENSFNDEWIELFNNTEQDIDLTGWLLKADDGTPEISLEGVIWAKSFYLLERTDDESVPEITADQIYTGALGNDGEDFQIFDNSGKLIDKVAICEAKWCAGDNETKQTMERIDSNSLGSDFDNWKTSQEAGGTPRAQNS